LIPLICSLLAIFALFPRINGDFPRCSTGWPSFGAAAREPLLRDGAGAGGIRREAAVFVEQAVKLRELVRLVRAHVIRSIGELSRRLVTAWISRKNVAICGVASIRRRR